MDQATLDRAVYQLAVGYLFSKPGITPELLELHLAYDEKERPRNLADVYRKLVWCAQDTQSMPNVIGGAIGGVDNLRSLLCEYNAAEVAAKYPAGEAGSTQLFADIKAQLQPRGQLREGSRGLWPRYCRALTSGAAFLAQFRDLSDFTRWVDHFDRDDRTRAGAPLIMAAEIDGLGFALACSFLMGLGYSAFGKPDVHVKKIFVGTGLSRSDGEYAVFKAMGRVARNTGKSAYEVDQVFWLVGSGDFYRAGVKVQTNRDEFIGQVLEAIGGAGAAK